MCGWSVERPALLVCVSNDLVVNKKLDEARPIDIVSLRGCVVYVMLDNHEVGQQKARIVEAMGFAGPVVTPSAVKFCCPAHIFDILFYTLIIRLFSPPRRIKLFDREEKRSTSSSSRPQSWCGHSRMPSRWILQSSPMPSNVGYVRGVFLVKGNASL